MICCKHLLYKTSKNQKQYFPFIILHLRYYFTLTILQKPGSTYESFNISHTSYNYNTEDRLRIKYTEVQSQQVAFTQNPSLRFNNYLIFTVITKNNKVYNDIDTKGFQPSLLQKTAATTAQATMAKRTVIGRAQVSENISS